MYCARAISQRIIYCMALRFCFSKCPEVLFLPVPTGYGELKIKQSFSKGKDDRIFVY